MKNDDLKMCTFDPKHIIISHQGQQPMYNIIIIGLHDEFETTNYFNYQKNLESFLETCIIMIYWLVDFEIVNWSYLYATKMAKYMVM